MYRTLLTVFLYIESLSAAPQEGSFEIAVVQPTVYDQLPTNESKAPSEAPSEAKVLDVGITDPLQKSNVDIEDITTESNMSDTTEYVDEVTSSYDKVTDYVSPTDYEVITKAPSPRFFSKLSYFQKPSYYEESSLKNLIERTGKRKYKSKCRCEKIWNCPKLQITVPRCPDEYFLCCF